MEKTSRVLKSAHGLAASLFGCRVWVFVLGVLTAFPGSSQAEQSSFSEIDTPRTCSQIHERTQGVGSGWLEQLITVGEAAAMIADECLKKGMPNTKIKTFVTAEEAAQHLLRGGLHTGDVILLKGSQNRVRLERAVKLLMNKPEQAAAMLCRQEKIWQKIP